MHSAERLLTTHQRSAHGCALLRSNDHGHTKPGKLYIFPGIHNGWSKRQLYRGTMPRNAKQVFAGNAMGTGYLWFDQPLR